MTEYTRMGECNNCGWCCQFVSIFRITVPTHLINADSERFYALRRGTKRADGKVQLIAHQFAPCSVHNNENKCCTIYDDRPEVCKVFPSIPDQIEGSPCSYWFMGIDENGEVVRRGGLDSPHPTPPLFTREIQQDAKQG